MFRRHPILSIATFAYLGIVGWITLGPQPVPEGDESLLWRALAYLSRNELTDWITYQRVEFGANVLMFVPVGMFFLLLFGRRRWFAGILAGIVLTCLIEFTQLFLPDRVSDVSDIIANSIGTAIGVLFVLVVTTPKARRLRRERQLASAGRSRESVGSRR